ncbi:hypothetical protein Nepgr_020204 [Nepenthes gracilis]|uniref:Pentatricopeptide repeat-containing protein n=1 Tax=Nepenthes gracilis TaxID=150966 RepID=A0AAD3SUJ4_NEPGR|nr:hypothetical protein Nepgr_020204 [Nepenthes gracilis]
MFARTRITRSWKHHRWKNINELYSTLSQFPHAYIPYVIARNIDIDYFAKSGQLEVARSLFDEMPTRTVVTWNTMISGYAKWGSYTEALNLVSSMHCSSTKLNETTFSTVLSLCSHSQSLTSGRQIHCLLLKFGAERFDLVGSGLLYFYASCFNIHDARCVFDGLHESNPLVWSLMVVGCVKCNLMDDALDVFMKMPSRDVVSWTTLISGYSKSAEGCEKALQLFKMMRENDDVRPNEFTLDCVLRACGTLRILREGKCVHGLVFKFGFEFDESIGGALIDMYCNCEAVDDGKRAYDALTFPCLNASNSLIGGYILLGRIEDAELVFNGMLERNPVSYNLMIKGYATIGRVDDSKKLFATMPKKL